MSVITFIQLVALSDQAHNLFLFKKAYKRDQPLASKNCNGNIPPLTYPSCYCSCSCASILAVDRSIQD